MPKLNSTTKNLEAAIEAAIAPGAFISWRQIGDFVSELTEVADGG